MECIGECEGRVNIRVLSIVLETFVEFISCGIREAERGSHHRIAKVSLGYQSTDSKIASRFARRIITAAVCVFAFPLSGTETYDDRMIREMYKLDAFDKKSCPFPVSLLASIAVSSKMIRDFATGLYRPPTIE